MRRLQAREEERVTVKSVDLTADRLRSELNYDPESGVFTWRSSTSHRVMGARAGTVEKEGYLVISVFRRQYRAHRLAWLYVRGQWPLHQIDHINGTRADNRISNLRDVPQTLNQQNKRCAGSNNRSSCLLGVSWHRRHAKWVAAISVAGKRRNLGYFETAEAASAAYLSAKREMHPGMVDLLGVRNA